MFEEAECAVRPEVRGQKSCGNVRKSVIHSSGVRSHVLKEGVMLVLI